MKEISTCSTSQSVTQRKELWLANNSSEGQKPKSGYIFQMIENVMVMYLEYRVASEQFLIHVSKLHKV